MQFTTLTMALLAATAVSALPEPRIRFGKPGGSGKPSNGGSGGSGGGVSWKWDAASLAIDVASLSSDLAFNFAGDAGQCEALNKAGGCWKDYCWSACNAQQPTWWAWAARTEGGQDWVSCSSDSQCLGGGYKISQEGCGC